MVKMATNSDMARRASAALLGAKFGEGPAAKMTEKESFVLETRLLLQHLSIIEITELHKVRRDVRRSTKSTEAGVTPEHSMVMAPEDIIIHWIRPETINGRHYYRNDLSY